MSDSAIEAREEDEDADTTDALDPLLPWYRRSDSSKLGLRGSVWDTGVYDSLIVPSQFNLGSRSSCLLCGGLPVGEREVSWCWSYSSLAAGSELELIADVTLLVEMTGVSKSTYQEISVYVQHRMMEDV